MNDGEEKRKAFLTARWVNVVLLTYRVPGEILREYLPAGCELDLWEGEAHVSLVAFDFLGTRVRGVSVPGVRDFPEINLRFYVRCEGRRGVCFVREFVPSRLVAGVARWLYNEPYRAVRMKSETREEGGELCVRHEVVVGGKKSSLEVRAGRELWRPGKESVEYFFKEHEWGFGRERGGRLVRYRVEHPEWEVYRVRKVLVEWDWAGVYGEKWGVLRGTEPRHVMMAAGSGVEVSPRG